MMSLKGFRVGLIALLFALTVWSVAFAHGGKHKSAEAGGKVSYAKDILPLFEGNCSSCHGVDSPEHTVFMKNMNGYVSNSVGPRMDSYTLISSFIVWPDTGSLMRSLDDGSNTPDGKPGGMYRYLGATREERKANLGLFKSWVGYWTLKSWPEISKDEIDRLELAP